MKKLPRLTDYFEGKKPLDVAIELGLMEKQVYKFFRDFWKLKRLNKLYQIYPEIGPSLQSFLKLHSVLNDKGMMPKNVEWFVDARETGSITL
jgi:hypothetical protein